MVKVAKIVKSKLKVVLPVFQKGDEVKCDIPKATGGREIRYGIVTSNTDNEFKMAIRVKFENQKAVSVNKDYVCLPRNAPVSNDNF